MTLCMICHQEYPESRKNFICFLCWSELDLFVHNLDAQKKTSQEEEQEFTLLLGIPGAIATIVGHSTAGVDNDLS